jgi:hypothetical protein
MARRTESSQEPEMGRRGIVGALLLALPVLAGCQDEFPLGSWGQAPAAGQGGAAGSGVHTGGMAGTSGINPLASPSCGEVGIPGALNAPGSSVGTTNLYTDWSWAAPLDSLEWDLVMESDPENDGYYWAHQFSFVNGLTGFFGIQAHGGYQQTKDDNVDFVKMALLWISSGELTAELSDIQGDDARTMVVSTRGTQWTTINAKYEWSACTVYRLRLGKDGTDALGNVWYAAWIEDRATTLLTKIGRIAVPAEWGQISRLTTTLTTRIDDKPPPPGVGPVTTCADPEPASAIFGTPSGNDGQLVPTHFNRFPSPARCPSSRFTDLPEGVRHEIGLRAP